MRLVAHQLCVDGSRRLEWWHGPCSHDEEAPVERTCAASRLGLGLGLASRLVLTP